MELVPLFLLINPFILFIISFYRLYPRFNNKYDRQDKNMIVRISLLDSDNKKDECCMCLENYSKHQKILILECNHFFHYRCITEWLQNKTSCPLCRNDKLPPIISSETSSGNSTSGEEEPLIIRDEDNEDIQIQEEQ